MKSKTVVIVAHKFLTQPDDELVKYLNSLRIANLLHIKHSFADAKDRRSTYTWYQNGEISKEELTPDYANQPEPFIYLKEFYFTLVWTFKVVRTVGSIDAYIGMDGLCVFFGLFTRLFVRLRKIIFWAIDFVPENRFKAGWKNSVYSFINSYSYKNVDELWDLSPRMAEARKKFGGIEASEKQIHKVIPYGVWHADIKRYAYKDCEQNTMVFMGHLIPKQGVQLVLQAMPKILRANPDFRFKIIGGGHYEEELKKLANDLGILDRCNFLGRVANEDHDSILIPEIAKSCVAIAPYIKQLDTWTYYADPGKVKTYLSAGVPVLLTELPWNAYEIERSGCGFVLTGAEDDLVEKTLTLMSGEKNQEFRTNATNYSKSSDYHSIFLDLL